MIRMDTNTTTTPQPTLASLEAHLADKAARMEARRVAIAAQRRAEAAGTEREAAAIEALLVAAGEPLPIMAVQAGTGLQRAIIFRTVEASDRLTTVRRFGITEVEVTA